MRTNGFSYDVVKIFCDKNGRMTGSTITASLTAMKNARTDQDLTGLSFVAKTRGDVGYRPDRGVVEAPLEADGLHPDWVAGISIGAIKTCRSDVR